MINDIDAAIRTKQKPERIAGLLELLRSTAEEHIRQQWALLREIRPHTYELQDLPRLTHTPETERRNAPLVRFARLTIRERQVLKLVVKGSSNKEIARILGIGRRTVESHRASGMKKIGARSLPELIRFAITGVSSDNT